MKLSPVPLPDLVGRRVDIYLNLHKPPGTLSVRAADGPERGLVLAHVRGIELEQCVFVVSVKGQARVRATRRKEVHAYVRGIVRQAMHESPDLREARTQVWRDARPVRYDPYETDTFVDRETGDPVHSADAMMAFGAYLLAHGTVA